MKPPKISQILKSYQKYNPPNQNITNPIHHTVKIWKKDWNLH